MKFYIKKINSSILKFNQVNKIQAILILLLIVFYTYLIYALPLFQWDESRLGVNAIEMLQSHHFLSPTYFGEPDYWNTKPPFAIWSMCTSIFLFGLSVFTKQQIRIEAYKVAQNKAWQKHIKEKAILNHFTYQKYLFLP